MTVLRTPVETRGEDMTTVADFEVSEGETIPFVLTYGPSHLPLPQPIDPAQALQDTEEFWTEWCSRCTYRGRPPRSGDAFADHVEGADLCADRRHRRGADHLAAGEARRRRNWDYRFCWLRDATFTLLALMNSGYTEEAAAWHNWLLRAAAGSPANMQIMYGIMGQRRLLEWEADWLSGYEGAQPVRVGNAAHAQLQLDVYGELIDAFHQSRMAELQLDEGSWALGWAVLHHLDGGWDQPDHGIWERRGAESTTFFRK